MIKLKDLSLAEIVTFIFLFEGYIDYYQIFLFDDVIILHIKDITYIINVH